VAARARGGRRHVVELQLVRPRLHRLRRVAAAAGEACERQTARYASARCSDASTMQRVSTMRRCDTARFASRDGPLNHERRDEAGFAPPLSPRRPLRSPARPDAGDAGVLGEDERPPATRGCVWVGGWVGGWVARVRRNVDDEWSSCGAAGAHGTLPSRLPSLLPAPFLRRACGRVVNDDQVAELGVDRRVVVRHRARRGGQRPRRRRGRRRRKGGHR
jgi:hypothetical protein